MDLYPANPRYLRIDDEPRILMGSGEHYGALLNLDFDYATYFGTLGEYGLNQTRVFSGTYRERPGHFGIEANTLAPQPGRYVSPWVEVEPDRFDLGRTNPAWRDRLRDLLEHARQNRVVVEIVLFCFWYGDEHWRASPMHPQSNTASIGTEERNLVYALDGNQLLPVQERFVREAVAAVNDFDNVYFEVCNEPYSRHNGTADLEWQHHIVDVITETESALPNRHLVAINYQNRSHVIPRVHAGVSILNFHYALPEAVLANAHYELPIGDDETGFCGQTAEPYRREAWKFFFSGGATFSHLDYGFTCDHPEGGAPIVGKTPGYGGDDLRRQLVFLREVLEENEVWKLRVANELFAQNTDQLPGQALCEHGRRYLFYIPQSSPGRTIALWIPSGTHRVEWINPSTCTWTHEEQIEVKGRFHRLLTPAWSGDLAFRITPLPSSRVGRGIDEFADRERRLRESGAWSETMTAREDQSVSAPSRS